MNTLRYSFSFIIAVTTIVSAEILNESDVNFRVEPGTRTCFFERGIAGHTLELFYHVLDGQHGDYDISFDVIDPNGKKILSDYKKSQNSVLIDLETDGDYAFCMDNTYSLLNSKLVFVYVMIEKQVKENDTEAPVSFINEDGVEKTVEEVLQWVGKLENGDDYYIDVDDIENSLSRTLKHVAKARHLLDLYGAMKTKDSYLAFEETFVIDIWSGFQISFMFVVGMLQVYMIKSLFGQSQTVLHTF